MRKILGDFNYLAILQKMNGFIVFCVLALSLVASSLAEKQNITIKGIALCNKRTMANAHVELMEKDTIDPNDLLAEIHTNKEGEFQLFAEEDEVFFFSKFLEFQKFIFSSLSSIYFRNSDRHDRALRSDNSWMQCQAGLLPHR
ncbi:hypothetical protein WR25_05474 isoform D [Diploscapter pachys]|uniref:Transthyretin-like family protein n=1 Tax=Diploscapter pachys TaxID=2018661 RepID=A0A2A2LWN1_9BILA|nr:hypothetical protein WR25_05474 isoform B [Diploscapter pachys]PAV90663.1 hypothetical protein WR25_05474 isoform D [Diploscapter pachys]